MDMSPHFPIYMDYGATTPVDQRVGNGSEIDVFQFTAHRHSARQTGAGHPARLEQFTDDVGGGLAFGGEIGGQNHFFDHAIAGALQPSQEIEQRRVDIYGIRRGRDV